MKQYTIKKIIAIILVVTIIAPAGLLIQPKKAEASCSLGGGGGGGEGGGPGTDEGMLPMTPRFAIKILTEETPLSFGGNFDVSKGMSGSNAVFNESSVLKNTIPLFDYQIPAAKGDLAMDASQAWQAIQAAYAVISNAISCITSVVGSVTSFATKSLATKEFVLDGIAYAIINQIIADMLNDIQRWAVTGFKGSPVFITNPEKYFKGLADDMLGAFLNEIAGVNLCSLKWGPLITAALDIDLGYRQRAQCTFSGIEANFDQFVNDFSQGGWSAWIQLTTRAQNNPYGSYLLAAQEAANRIGTVPQGILGKKLLELNWGKGMLSMTRCTVSGATQDKSDGFCKDSEGNPVGSQEIVTPGSMIESAINDSNNMSNNRIVAADEINETIIALMYGLIVKTFSSDKGYAGADWSGLASQVNSGGALNTLRSSLIALIDKFTVSEANYKKRKEASLVIVKGGESALNKLATCYNDQIKLNNQYEKDIASLYFLGAGYVVTTATNNPFSGFSSTTVATKIQNTLGIITQNITPWIVHFQKNIASSTEFIVEISQMKASTTNTTTNSGLDNISKIFSTASARWHDEVAAEKANIEVDDIRRSIEPIVKQADADFAECRITRKNMREFIILYGVTPVVPAE